MPAFPLPALRYILGNILGPTIILFYFLKNKVFSYKTLDVKINKLGDA